MNAMILAAGRGERMRPLTDDCPKPLLAVGGRALIDWHLQRLAAAGVRRVVVNTAWRGERLREHLGDGSAWGLTIAISDEGEHALETAGGIANALPLLGEQPFWVVNGDIWSDFDFRRLPRAPVGQAHLVVVPNPEHHAEGDFHVVDGRVAEHGSGGRYTFAGIGCYRPGLFQGLPALRHGLGAVLHRAVANGQVTATVYGGSWMDVGTPQRLHALDRQVGEVRSDG